MDESQRAFANEDEEATYCLGLLRDGDRTQKIVARERLSQIFERRGLLDEAAQCLETNVREGIRDPRIYQRLAGVYRRQGRHELADEVLLEARRLAERANRPPPGARPIRGGRPPVPRRVEPPPGPLEAPTSQLPAPPMPAPDPAEATRGGLSELSLDSTRPPLAETPADTGGPVARPWYTSPVVVVLGLLLCGPFGAFVLAAMWARGGYSKRARVTAVAVWLGLMVLASAAAAVTLQSQMPLLLSDPGRLGVVPAPAPVAGTPLIFPTPVGAPGVGTSPVATPATAPSPPPVAVSPGELGARPSPVQISPPGAAVVGATPAAGSGASAASGERLRVHDVGPTGANMRDKPGTVGTVVKTVPEGAIVQVVGQDQAVDGRTWRHVKDDAGGDGWIASDLLEPAT